MIKDITLQDFDATVLAANKPVILDFWAPWCGPCKALTPQLERIAKQHADALDVVKIDVDQSPDARQRFGLRGVPTLIGFVNGQEVIRTTGVASGSLSALVAAVLKPTSGAEALSSFFGKASLKQQALSKLLDAATRGELLAARPTESGPLLECMPAELLARALGGSDYLEALGLPNELAALHDAIYELMLDLGQGANQAHAFLSALPVGQDLSNRKLALASTLLYHERFGLAVVASRVLSASQLDVSALLAAHRADLSLQPIQFNWETVRTKVRSLVPTVPYSQARLLDAMASFIKPLNEFSSMDLTALLSEIMSANDIIVERFWWTPEEAALLKTMDDYMEKLTAGLAQQTPVAEEEMLKIQLAAEAFRNNFWAQHPGLKTRQDEMLAAMTSSGQSLRAEMNAVVLSVLGEGQAQIGASLSQA